jgi:predicted transposase YdaD
MHEYDITLKSILRRLTGTVLRDLTGFTVARWHNVELPAVQNRRADMLGETADGTLVHIELQSANQSGMALRMLEYATAIHRQFGRFPHQMVLYVGRAPLRMPGKVAGPHLEFTCKMVDIRELDSEPLLMSSRVEDNVIAVLARLSDQREAVKRILIGIAACEPPRRQAALDELMLLAGLRELAPVIRQEAEQMPILDDIMDHAVLGPERRRGIQIGIEQGREQGREEGERKIVLRQIAKRFGPVPAAARKRIEALSAPKLERIALRLLDAHSLDELLG